MELRYPAACKLVVFEFGQIPAELNALPFGSLDQP
jgi:hypothetical protein